MDLIIIFGPPAVGKMTVGMELEKKTGLKLFHNHMSIEFVQPFFNYGTPMGKKLVGEFRWRIFEEVAKSDLPGLIFTFVWAFNLPDEKKYIDKIVHLFESQGARTSYVELYSPQETLIQRNTTELRLENKKSKRNTNWSHNNLIELTGNHKLNTNDDFYYPNTHLKIDNSNSEASQVADSIINHFKLKRLK